MKTFFYTAPYREQQEILRFKIYLPHETEITTNN
jgi:hypothetical protein